MRSYWRELREAMIFIKWEKEAKNKRPPKSGLFDTDIETNYLVTRFSKTGSALMTGAGAACMPPAVRSEAYGGCVST